MSAKLKKSQLDDAKKQLEERKKELQQVLTHLSLEKLDDEGDVRDPGDEAMSSSMETLISSYQENEAIEYDRILKALKSIEDGTYGVCIDCDNEISEKRLKYYPNASRCLACQETLESSLSE